MDHDGCEFDSWAAFRVSWPGAAIENKPAPPARGLQSLFARWREMRACTGWPVRLAAPGPERAPPLPKVKLTGRPLD
jgi:hypothetical protein